MHDMDGSVSTHVLARSLGHLCEFAQEVISLGEARSADDGLDPSASSLEELFPAEFASLRAQLVHVAALMRR